MNSDAFSLCPPQWLQMLRKYYKKEIDFCILISLGKIIWTFTVVYFGCKKKKKKEEK